MWIALVHDAIVPPATTRSSSVVLDGVDVEAGRESTSVSNRW
jgi:hypothetical protein